MENSNEGKHLTFNKICVYQNAVNIQFRSYLKIFWLQLQMNISLSISILQTSTVLCTLLFIQKPRRKKATPPQREKQCWIA